MNENQVCGAVGAAGETPFLDVADAVGGSPFCDAVGVADEIPSCGAVDVAPVCCGWCGTELTGADAVADGTDQWESP